VHRLIATSSLLLPVGCAGELAFATLSGWLVVVSP
jgi:hypothetical protein